MLSPLSNAIVSGTVRDQNGAVIPNAPVVLTKSDTNAVSKSATNEAGLYVFPGVVPGPYQLEVSSPGMQTFQATLAVQAQQSVVVNPVLMAGRTTTTVEVKDVTPTVTVYSPTLGTVLERGRIETLPLNGRATLPPSCPPFRAWKGCAPMANARAPRRSASTALRS